MIGNALIHWVKRQNPKFAYLYTTFGQKPFTLLDIGAGNQSATKTLRLFPNCSYHGLDLSRDYNNQESDFSLMKAFYELDLTKLQFHEIPDNHFDSILIVHVIEHLFNGDQVLVGLLPKLKKGGTMYVEYPCSRSTKLPSMRGTLNYHDDSTHVRLYSIPELKGVLEGAGCTVKSSGFRRSWFYVLATPFRILLRWARGKAVTGNIFWDLLGFAEYVVVQKN